MKCFNHIKEEAVGVCKHCSKSLCPDCLTDLDFGIACKNTHEAEVKEINRIINISSKLYENPNLVSGNNANMAFMKYAKIAYFLLGLVFIVTGIFSKTIFPIALGAIFIIFFTIIPMLPLIFKKK